MIEQTQKCRRQIRALKTTTAHHLLPSAKKLHSSGSRQPSYALVQSFQPGIGALQHVPTTITRMTQDDLNQKQHSYSLDAVMLSRAVLCKDQSRDYSSAKPMGSSNQILILFAHPAGKVTGE